MPVVWLLKYWRFLAAGAAVLGVLAALWYIHRNIYQNGYKACQAAYETAAAKAAANAHSLTKDVSHETSRMDDAAIDADLARLGILRRTEDR